MSIIAIIFAIIMLIIHRDTFSAFQITMIILACMGILAIDLGNNNRTKK